MKRFATALILMSFCFICFGQSKETDEPEHKIQQLKAEIKHHQFVMEQELYMQTITMQINMEMEIDMMRNRMITERLLFNIYGPNMRELVEYPYLCLLPFVTSEFPVLNIVDIYDWRIR